MNDKEIWMPIAGFDDEISNMGNVRNYKFGYERKRKPTVNSFGYAVITLTKNGKQCIKRLNRLVWEAFNGPIPDGLQVNHINENKLDNRLENLNLMTCKENNNWGTRTDRMKTKLSKPVRCIKEFSSVSEAAEWLGGKEKASGISEALSGKLSSAYGFTWEYKNN